VKAMLSRKLGVERAQSLAYNKSPEHPARLRQPAITEQSPVRRVPTGQIAYDPGRYLLDSRGGYLPCWTVRGDPIRGL